MKELMHYKYVRFNKLINKKYFKSFFLLKALHFIIKKQIVNNSANIEFEKKVS